MDNHRSHKHAQTPSGTLQRSAQTTYACLCDPLATRHHPQKQSLAQTHLRGSVGRDAPTSRNNYTACGIVCTQACALVRRRISHSTDTHYKRTCAHRQHFIRIGVTAAATAATRPVMMSIAFANCVACIACEE